MNSATRHSLTTIVIIKVYIWSSTFLFIPCRKNNRRFPCLYIILVFIDSSLQLSFVTPWVPASPATTRLKTHRDGTVKEYYSSTDICHDLLTITMEHCVLGPFVNSREANSFKCSSLLPKSAHDKPFFKFFYAGKSPWHNDSASSKNWLSILTDCPAWYNMVKAGKEDMWERASIQDAHLLTQYVLAFDKPLISDAAYF